MLSQIYNNFIFILQGLSCNKNIELNLINKKYNLSFRANRIQIFILILENDRQVVNTAILY